METFDFPYHRVSRRYPQTGTSLEFGQGYQFTAPPAGRYQRQFVLKFPTLAYFENDNGQVDPTIQPQKNMLAFIEFYERHLLHKSFLYNHPDIGLVTVKFAAPFEEPDGIPKGHGASEAFEITLIEQP